MKAGTQPERLYRYLRENPGASSLEIIRDLAVTNATGRLSDLRDIGEREGFVIVRERRPDGRDGYSIAPAGQATLGLTA